MCRQMLFIATVGWLQDPEAPVVNGQREERMRVGCGSATVGMFAAQWKGLVDEVVVVDDHITGVMSEHQAGKVIGWPATGIKIKGRRSTPGRYQRRRPAFHAFHAIDAIDAFHAFHPIWADRAGILEHLFERGQYRSVRADLGE